MADVTYLFSDLDAEPRPVRLVDRRSGRSLELGAGVADHRLSYVGFRELPSHVADLVDLAVSIYVADWLTTRRADEAVQIEIVLPVRNPQTLGNARVTDHLRSLLRWYTGDRWSFAFTRRQQRGRLSETQRALPLANQPTATSVHEVALWSGGLDSLAGLHNRLLEGPAGRAFGLLGAGANPVVLNKQRQLIQALRRRCPSRRIVLIQVPIRLRGTGGWPQNRYFRARGLVFKLLGAITTHLAGLHRLQVYENGIGAINLPYSQTEVGLDHTRAVHPISPRMFADFASLALGSTLRVHNPFLYWTKAEMCQAFIEEGTTDLVCASESCDSPHRRPGYRQCGYCSSCLLRRQALAAAGIADQTRYVIQSGRQPRGADVDFLRLMLFQVGRLRSDLCTPDPWEAMVARHPGLFDLAEEQSQSEGVSRSSVAGRLVDLYGRYVREWEQAAPMVGADLMDADEVEGWLDRRPSLRPAGKELST